MRKILYILVWVVASASLASSFDCLSLNSTPVLQTTYSSLPSGDFLFRDQLPQTDIPKDRWSSPDYGKYGPCPMTFPKVVSAYTETVEWSRSRVLAAAKKYIGLPYKRHHIPAMGGLDCSNFTSWVYNFGFGIRFSSNILKQSESAGRRLTPDELLAPGDLIFLYDESEKQIAHVAIFVDENHVIDSASDGVQLRVRAGRYLKNFAWARRVFE